MHLTTASPSIPLFLLQQPRLNTIQLDNVPIDERVLPSMHCGESISRDRFTELMDETKNHKKNVDGLVYNEHQAPTRSNSKGWKHVIWGPVDRNYTQWYEKSLFKFETKNDGHILVQFFQDDVDNSIREGVEYFLQNHSNVRDKSKHEGGSMVAGGLHFDPPTSMLLRYSNTKNKKCSDKDQQKQKDCFIQIIVSN